ARLRAAREMAARRDRRSEDAAGNDVAAGRLTMAFDRIAVLGGGAWGTALANVTARAGRKVTLWEYDASNASELAERRESKFLRGVRIENSIAVTRDLANAARAEAILLVVPAQAMRSVVKALADSIAPRTPIIA